MLEGVNAEIPGRGGQNRGGEQIL